MSRTRAIVCVTFCIVCIGIANAVPNIGPYAFCKKKLKSINTGPHNRVYTDSYYWDSGKIHPAPGEFLVLITRQVINRSMSIKWTVVTSIDRNVFMLDEAAGTAVLYVCMFIWL